MIIQGDDLIFEDFCASEFGLTMDVSFDGMIDSEDDIMITPTAQSVFTGERPDAKYLTQQYENHLELTAILAHDPCNGEFQKFHQQELRHILRCLKVGKPGYSWLNVVTLKDDFDDINYEYHCRVSSVACRTQGDEIVGVIITFECDGGFAYTPPLSRTLDFIEANETRQLFCNAQDDMFNYLLPKVTIQAKTAGNLTLTNKSDNNFAFTFNDLRADEILTIDSSKEIITSNKGRSTILNNTNMHFPRLIAGENAYTSNLPVKVTFLYRESIKVGFVP